MVRKIYWGHYSFNTVTSEITRLKHARGTWPGRVLAPYYPNKSGEAYVKFSINSYTYQQKLSTLEKRYAS